MSIRLAECDEKLGNLHGYFTRVFVSKLVEPGPLATVQMCGKIDAEGPPPRIAVLDVDRRAPNRPNLLAEAGPVGTRVECEDTGVWRQHRRCSVGEGDGLHIASLSGPVLQRFGLRREV